MGWGTNLVRFRLRSTGTSLLLEAEPAPGGSQSFIMDGLQVRRFRHEGEVLRALEAAGIGRWSAFPPESIEATVTRDQLFQIGFRGVY